MVLSSSVTQRISTRLLLRLALLSAMAFLLMLWEVQLTPVFPFLPGFLKYDAGELPVLIAGTAFGPWPGVVVELIKNLLFLASGKSSAGLIGVSANLAAGIAFVVPAAWLYRRLRPRAPLSWQLPVALVAGVVSTTVVMSVANYYVFLPLWGVPAAQIGSMVVSAIVPFNLIKGTLTSILMLLVYPRLAAVFADTSGAVDEKSRTPPAGQE